MYDINFKNVKKGRWFFGIFLFVGLFFFIFTLAAFMIVNKALINALDSSTEASSIIINEYRDSDSETRYSPEFHYIVDGNEYTCSSGSSFNYKPEVNKTKIYYKSSDPSSCLTEYDKSFFKFFILFFLLPDIFIIIGLVGIIVINKKVKKVKELNKTGKLVKKIPFTLEPSNYTVNGRRVMKPVIEYKLLNGETVTLKGDARFDFRETDADNMVDLVIDEKNPKNYFIDFEINRIGGNRDSDFYKGNNIVQPDEEEIKYGIDDSEFY